MAIVLKMEIKQELQELRGKQRRKRKEEKKKKRKEE